MTISQFLSQCKYPDYQNDFAIFEEQKEHLRSSTIIFETERDFIAIISSKISSTIFESDKIINDMPEYEGVWEGDLIYKMQYFPYIIPHVSLSDIGIESFAICQNDNSVIVCYYNSLSKLEQSIIDIAIWNTCIDKIIENLSKLTIFKLSKSQFSTFSLESIIAENAFSQVNNATQLRMYIYDKFLDDLSLKKGTLVKHFLTVPKETVNPDVDWNQIKITLNISLDKEELNPGIMYDEDYDIHQVVPTTFQVIKNLDLSISLVPDTKDIIRLIEEQIHYLKEEFSYSEDRGLLLPTTLLPLVEYLNDNKIITCFGKVKRICSYEETLQMAKFKDKKYSWFDSFEETSEYSVMNGNKIFVIFE